MKETNTRNFLQATDRDVNMYAMFEYLNSYRFLFLNTSRFELLEFYRRE
jgi:hypothetical protein